MIKHGRGYTITRTVLQTRYIMLYPIRTFIAQARDASGVVAEMHASLEHGVTFSAMRASNLTREQWKIYDRLVDYARREVRRLRAEIRDSAPAPKFEQGKL